MAFQVVRELTDEDRQRLNATAKTFVERYGPRPDCFPGELWEQAAVWIEHIEETFEDFDYSGLWRNRVRRALRIKGYPALDGGKLLVWEDDPEVIFPDDWPLKA